MFTTKQRHSSSVSIKRKTNYAIYFKIGKREGKGRPYGLFDITMLTYSLTHFVETGWSILRAEREHSHKVKQRRLLDDEGENIFHNDNIILLTFLFVSWNTTKRAHHVYS